MAVIISRGVLNNAKKLLKIMKTEDVGSHFPFTRMPQALEEFDKQIETKE